MACGKNAHLNSKQTLKQLEEPQKTIFILLTPQESYCLLNNIRVQITKIGLFQI